MEKAISYGRRSPIVDPRSTIHDPRNLQPRRFVALCLLWGAIAAAWCVGLPALARVPGVAARLRRLDAAGIDPSAMFYSELPAMDDVLLRLDRLERRAAPRPIETAEVAEGRRDRSLWVYSARQGCRVLSGQPLWTSEVGAFPKIKPRMNTDERGSE